MALINGDNGNNSLVGTPFNDQIYGFDGFDTLNGSGGIDLLSGGRQGYLLFGGSSSDEMYGGKGNDDLSGDTGNDTLYGDEGNDTVEGNSETDTLSGGSGADLFVVIAGENDLVADFSSSQGDQVGVGGLSSSILSTSNVSEELNMPFFVELKQQGNDLLIGDSISEGYTTLAGLGEVINDPLPLLSSIHFSKDPLLGNSEENSEPETDSQVPDRLTRLTEAEANLIRQIEHLEAGGSLSELGIQGPGVDTLTTRDLQGALSEVQGRISDELARQEEAALADNFLLPEPLQPGKQVFLIEEGTSIPLNIQQEMTGGEVLFVPSGYFNTPASEGLF